VWTAGCASQTEWKGRSLPGTIVLGHVPGSAAARQLAGKAAADTLPLSAVDLPARRASTQFPNGIAIIIGVEEYSHTFPATYKGRDAQAFYRLCHDVLGIPSGRILLRTNSDATKAEFDYIFEPRETANQGWLKKRLRTAAAASEADLIVYLAGHGFPDMATGTPYFIPFDVRPEQATNGIALAALYRTLGDFGTRSVTVFVESCFSGVTGYRAGGQREALARNMNPVGLRLLQPTVATNTVVFAATSGDSPSSNRDDLAHGIFTYYVLAGLQGAADANADDDITVAELFDYLRLEVPRKALQAPLDREQIPEILPRVERLGARAEFTLVGY
jgi:uncharacterized caspase-like protein